MVGHAPEQWTGQIGRTQSYQTTKNNRSGWTGPIETAKTPDDGRRISGQNGNKAGMMTEQSGQAMDLGQNRRPTADLPDMADKAGDNNKWRR